MDMPLAEVLEMVDQLSDGDQAQVIDYLVAKQQAANSEVAKSSIDRPDQETLKHRLRKWLDEMETLEYQAPIARSGLKKEVEDILVEKYRRKGLTL